MNLIITTNCNHNCEYCFVMQHQGKNMDIEQIDYLTNLPDFADLDKINILGGEPTLHPQLPEIIYKVRSANSSAVIQLFSHCGNEPKFLEEIVCKDLILVANCYESRYDKNVRENFRVAREKEWPIVLSITIAEKDINIDNIISFCKEENIKIVRWSLAMPSYGTNNTYISRSHYVDYLDIIEEYNKRLLIARIASYNDCPLSPCLNKNSHYAKVKNVYTAGIRYGVCQPPYDIYPDYLVTGCMGIGSRIKIDLSNIRSVSTLNRLYNEQVNQLRNTRKLSIECLQCQKCDGGCFGFY